MPQDDSFQDLMARLRAGDQDAASQLLARFAHRLIALARSRLGSLIRQKVDPEDVVQSVFRSFFLHQADGQWDLESWDGLWALLTIITLRKCGHCIDHFRAARRDVQREANFPASADGSAASWEAIDRDPTPAEAAMLTETVERLMRDLSERDRQVLELKLQGETVSRISEQVRCSENTVGRVLERIRKRLERMYAPDGPAS